jgi:DNA (cytosine-5)-methyltransferase 1
LESDFFIPELAEEQALYQSYMNFIYDDIPFPSLKNPKFTFIDLFAGIGGFRIAMQNLGGKCVFSSEWDKYSKKLMRQILAKFLMGHKANCRKRCS